MRTGLRERIKDHMFRVPAFQDAWIAFRRRQLHRDYTVRREYYAKLARERGLVYREDEVVAAIRDRLASRGYSPPVRRMGEIHTFAFIPRIGWHLLLYNDLKELGPVSEFDYIASGYQWEDLTRLDSEGAQCRQEMRASFLRKLGNAHARRPVDWVYIYAHGNVITASLIERIIDELGIPVVNMCLDDKQSWAGRVFDGQRAGQIDIAAAFDLSWTSARVACQWYLVEGGRPIYMPEGFDTTTCRPMSVKQDIPVSFIGSAYGFRPSVIRYLQRYGISIQPFGQGWGTQYLSTEEIIEVMNRSVINLGMGGIVYSESLTNVKGRDFEITGVGGGVYLTSFNPDLAQHFVVGEEILCYRTREEMVELIRYYLGRPDKARAISRRGRERCLAEHRWLHRYQQICQILGILDAENKEDRRKR